MAVAGVEDERSRAMVEAATRKKRHPREAAIAEDSREFRDEDSSSVDVAEVAAFVQREQDKEKAKQEEEQERL